MNGVLPVSVGYAAIGGGSVLAGAALSVRVRLSARARSLAQHAAAGTVLAGLVTNVLAKLTHRPGQLTWTAIGMVVGLAAMLAIRRFAAGEGRTGLGSLVVTIVTDVLADGVLIGLSAALDPGAGLLFAIALAPEMGLLGVTAAEMLGGRWPAARIVGAAAVTGAAITSTGGLGWLAAQGPRGLATAILGLGASVIIYLILEELLREAHETDEGPVEVAILFACFLPFFLAGIAIR